MKISILFQIVHFIRNLFCPVEAKVLPLLENFTVGKMMSHRWIFLIFLVVHYTTACFPGSKKLPKNNGTTISGTRNITSIATKTDTASTTTLKFTELKPLPTAVPFNPVDSQEKLNQLNQSVHCNQKLIRLGRN